MVDNLPGLGPSLRRAWIGYQRRLDEAMAAAGFADRGFPDGRVLRICARTEGTTISDIARDLGVTRQGAAKVVARLRELGYVTVSPSLTSGREKVVALTPRALEYLTAQRRAARTIERQLRARIGPEAFAALHLALDDLGRGEDSRLRDYLTTRLSRH